MNTESLLFRKKAADYLVCFNDECPKAGQCLRRKVADYVPDTRRLLLNVNPSYVARKKGKCEYFQSAEPVLMGKGLAHFYDKIPESKARAIRKQLLSHFGNSNYYRYRSGERLITPEVKKFIIETCKKNGWNEEPVFDDVVQDYQW